MDILEQQMECEADFRHRISEEHYVNRQEVVCTCIRDRRFTVSL